MASRAMWRLVLLSAASGLVTKVPERLSVEGDSPQLFRTQQLAFLETSINTLLAQNATPALANLTVAILEMMQSMKTAIEDQEKNIQTEVNTAHGNFAACPQISLGSSKTFLDDFTEASAKHKVCRQSESALADTNDGCLTQKKVAEDAKNSECSKKTTIEEESCKNPSTFCQVHDSESCSSYLNRMADKFQTATGNYASESASCSNKTQLLTAQTQTCTTAGSDLQTQRDTCNNVQTRMDIASCNYHKETKKGCQSCYDQTLTAYQTLSTQTDSKVEDLRREYAAVLHMECLADSLKKGSASAIQAAMSACKGVDFYASASGTVSITFQPAPTSASCDLPKATAGTAEYKAAQYDALPANAPAAKCACCTCDTHTCQGTNMILKSNAETITGQDDATCCRLDACSFFTCTSPNLFLKPQAAGIIGHDESTCCASFALQMSSCSATGMNGPIQTQCDNTYGAEYGVKVEQGAQLLTVPATGFYSLTAKGSKGGDHGGASGGPGATVSNTFPLEANDQLLVVVGQQGWTNPAHTDWGGGGGGATWVAKVVSAGGDDASAFKTGLRVETLLIAGGGAGPRDSLNSGVANAGQALGGTPTVSAEGGAAGGGASLQNGGRGGRGGSHPTPALLKGAKGGGHAPEPNSRNGGFGGGGAPYDGGGGGGGYEGGACNIGGTNNDCYGGTSFSSRSGATALAGGNNAVGSLYVQFTT